MAWWKICRINWNIFWGSCDTVKPLSSRTSCRTHKRLKRDTVTLFSHHTSAQQHNYIKTSPKIQCRSIFAESRWQIFSWQTESHRAGRSITKCILTQFRQPPNNIPSEPLWDNWANKEEQIYSRLGPRWELRKIKKLSFFAFHWKSDFDKDG